MLTFISDYRLHVCDWGYIVFRKMLAWSFEIPVGAKLTQNYFFVLSFCISNVDHHVVTFVTRHVFHCASHRLLKGDKNCVFQYYFK